MWGGPPGLDGIGGRFPIGGEERYGQGNGSEREIKTREELKWRRRELEMEEAEAGRKREQRELRREWLEEDEVGL